MKFVAHTSRVLPLPDVAQQPRGGCRARRALVLGKGGTCTDGRWERWKERESEEKQWGGMLALGEEASQLPHQSLEELL